jgi:cytoskeletal protein CcmA (bactofilin family)
MSRTGSQIGTGQRLLGDIAGEGDLQIDGRFEGAIHIGGKLTVGPGALVVAEVVAAAVHIDGRVEGRVRATGDVTIGRRGCLVGEVEGLLHVEEGGVFQGRIAHEGVPVDTKGELRSIGKEAGEPEKAVTPSAAAPPVHSFESQDVPAALSVTASGSIRRLTEDDTIPPAPPSPAKKKRTKATVTQPRVLSARAGRASANAAAKEVPITRKQRVRRDTRPKKTPAAQVRAKRKPAEDELGDAWFETKD